MKNRIIAATLVSGVLAAGFGVGYRHTGLEWLLSCAITFATVFYHFAMRLVVGALVPRHQNVHSPWFRQRSFEPGLYRALGVRKWKKYLPTFLPRQFSLEEATISQILENGCKAEVVHEIIVVLSFLPVLAIPALGAAGVFWATSCLSALLDGCFVIVQRYNRPRLQRIAQKEAHRL